MVRKFSEQDMENSSELINLKVQEIRERLQETQRHLQKIGKCGEEMDGNTSNAEEDEFILALKSEMPEVFENIKTTMVLLEESEELVKEV